MEASVGVETMLVEGSLSYDGVGEHPEWASVPAFPLHMELGA